MKKQKGNLFVRDTVGDKIILTINFIALTIAILGPFLDIELPLTVIQVLWINLIMDTFAAIALATDPPNPAVMKEPPRHPGDFIVSGKMGRQILVIGVICIALLTGFLLYMKNNGVVLGDNKMETTKASSGKYFTINGTTAWDELFENYAFLDGSPCGRLKENK